MICACYLKKNVVLLPTLGKGSGGPYYIGMEPVAVVAVSETDALRNALRETIRRGNPTAPRKLRADQPKDVILKYAGVKSVAEFQRSALCWWLTEDDGLYKITGLNDDPIRSPDQVEKFPAGTSIEAVVERMIAILQSAHPK